MSDRDAIRSTIGLLAILGVLFPGPAPAQDFQVNTYTLYGQFGTDVTRIGDGEFAVVWSSYDSPGSDAYYSIQARRFDPSGAPLGDQFQINTYTTGVQLFPRAAADGAGNFVVIWQDFIREGDRGLFGRRFAVGGAPLGGEFYVNTYTTGNQRRHEVARAPGGDFVVVWHSDGSYGSDGSGSSVQGQRFAANGLPLGGEFQINTFTLGEQSWPGVAAAESGDFVVVWHSSGSSGTDTSFRSVQGQRFAANGLPLGAEFQVNSFTPGDQRYPSVAMTPGGGFIVAWESFGSPGVDTDATSIQVRRFAADGTPRGPEFEVNTYTTDFQSYPHVAANGAGDFVVVWQSYAASIGNDNSNWSVAARRFASIGAPLGSEFQVNSYTTGYQIFPRVAVSNGGDFVVIWESAGSDGTDSSLRSVQSSGVLPIGVVFSDGFESGDSSAWSNSIP